MKIKANRFLVAQHLTCYNMYMGYLEGGPTAEDNQEHINRAIAKSKQIYKHLEPVVYTGNVSEGEVLPSHANIAWLDNWDQHMMLIWFTDGKQDIRESLETIIDNIDWNKLATEYCI